LNKGFPYFQDNLILPLRQSSFMHWFINYRVLVKEPGTVRIRWFKKKKWMGPGFCSLYLRGGITPMIKSIKKDCDSEEKSLSLPKDTCILIPRRVWTHYFRWQMWLTDMIKDLKIRISIGLQYIYNSPYER
jgi:hypothetical protein